MTATLSCLDSGAYMHCLARDIGAAPSVTWLAKHAGWKALVAYTMGQAFTPFFRMVGPFSDDHSMHVSSTELFETVRPICAPAVVDMHGANGDGHLPHTGPSFATTGLLLSATRVLPVPNTLRIE